MSKGPKFTLDQFKRARDYATYEPGFTPPFMAWELGWDLPTAQAITAELLKMDVIYMVEPPSRPYAAVYAYKVPTHRGDGGPRIFHLDQEEPEADLAAQRGLVVPHTRTQGSSGKPGTDRKRQKRGVQLKRRST